MAVLDGIWARIIKCAEAGALATETRMEMEIVNSVYNVLPNPTSAVFSPKCFVNAEFRLCFVTISALSRLPYAMFSPVSLLLLGSGAWRRFRGGLVLLPSPFGCAALDPLSSAKR